MKNYIVTLIMIFVKCLKYEIIIFSKYRLLLDFPSILQASQLRFFSLQPQLFLGQESYSLIVKTQLIAIASSVMYLFLFFIWGKQNVVLCLYRIHINRRNLNVIYLTSWASGRIQIPLKPCINRIAITICLVVILL